MTTVVDVLRLARDLYAQAPSHVPDPETPECGTYCVLTAILHAAARLDGSLFDAEWAMRRACSMTLVSWNAENSTETVLEAFDRAIEAMA